jgi:serine/threonine-protein kinase RsbW
MAELPNVCLSLANRPENVLLVREMLTGVAEGLGVPGGELNDIRTAVTEACNNVVLHAYEGGEGPLEIEVYGERGAIEVVVRDHGTGIKPRIRTAQEAALGIGLSLIGALVHRVEFSDSARNGTEVRMEFSTPEIRASEALTGDGVRFPAIADEELATTTGVAIAPACLARTVLPRVLSVLAVRAHFSTDRISDAQLVADALVGGARESLGESHLRIAASVAPREVELQIGPLKPGSARALIQDSAVDGLGTVIEKLTDDHRVAKVGSSEMLILRLTDRR